MLNPSTLVASATRASERITQPPDSTPAGMRQQEFKECVTMNRKKYSWKNLVSASGALALAFTIGCESERGADLRDDRWMVVPWYRETDAKPEPAPPAAQAQ